MIKIAFVIDTIASPTAGTEQQLLLLLKHLDRALYAPWLCVLYPSDWLDREFDLCPLHVADIRSFKSPRAYRRLWELSRFFRDMGIDIVQTHFRDSHIAGILAAKLAGIKTVIASRRNQGYWYTPRELLLQKLLNRWITLSIANSRSTKEWMVDVEGVAAERIAVIHNGVSLERFSASREVRTRYRSLLGIPEGAPCIGMVANLRSVKGVDVFIKAAPLIKENVPEAQFLIAGEGAERGRLEQLAAALRLDGSLRFLGRRTDIPQLMSAFDIGVLSSTSESLSNSLIEYMAAGLPVVTTEVGGSREAVEDGVTGFIVPVGDYQALAGAVLRILRDGGLAAAMGAEGKQRAERLFSLHRFIEASERCYRQHAPLQTGERL